LYYLSWFFVLEELKSSIPIDILVVVVIRAIIYHTAQKISVLLEEKKVLIGV